MRLALFQPAIPQNVGAAIRLVACMGVELEIIEPTAFPLTDRGLKRAALDYGPQAVLIRHACWDDFLAAPQRADSRLILFTTRSDQPYHRFAFRSGDTLLFGNESTGAADYVHAAADARLTIPIRAETRSLNLTVSCAIALSEALRQTDGLPQSDRP
jgi:tRNA (cytidine/uridine-2'-O-)-methyltransferase